MDIELVMDPDVCRCISCRHLQAWAGAYCGLLLVITVLVMVGYSGRSVIYLQQTSVPVKF